MTDWRDHYKDRDWAKVEEWFYHSEDKEEVAILRDCLRQDIPRVKRRNGVEEMEEYARPDEVTEEWRGGAEILHLGELDAILDGEPDSALQEWQKARTSLETKLASYTEVNEVTEGALELSRRAHAEQALQMLGDIDQIGSWMRQELNPDERLWLDERDCPEFCALAW
ncbi:hypothetical protein T8A63_11305 [Sulfitobacter sp. OXR-159]|uniref:hypothetical protein n=1 Tax=Sulfitobacter sp. OXR-159 TaxID=3100174 RepID=UPI002AC9D2E9|nr:hypothetical protein [Sulfitobacter sp. OXR-159]WPZ28247.1 hypothetical protein T8A63_11305 [Sulfitobacter sp. OXR-159]